MKRRIQIIGELETLLARIMARKATYKVRTTQLIVSADGSAMTHSILRNRFDDARTAAGIEKSAFPLRDLRAKAGTDKAESSGDILKADQLEHTTIGMTEKYVREGKGKQVTPPAKPYKKLVRNLFQAAVSEAKYNTATVVNRYAQGIDTAFWLYHQ
ncbi:hypothetical protein BKM17_06490 [Pseudomonas syringae group genomosp. 3]|nr:hypothetical protein BKM17_06490 [Pseudomonas syringae group genomosp. 3]